MWNPYIDTLVYKLHGHNAPFVCITVCEDSPQLLSSDIEGVVKVWDM